MDEVKQSLQIIAMMSLVMVLCAVLMIQYLHRITMALESKVYKSADGEKQ